MAKIAGHQRQIVLESCSRNPNVVIADAYALLPEMPGDARGSPRGLLIGNQDREVTQEAKAVLLLVQSEALGEFHPCNQANSQNGILMLIRKAPRPGGTLALKTTLKIDEKIGIDEHSGLLAPF